MVFFVCADAERGFGHHHLKRAGLVQLRHAPRHAGVGDEGLHVVELLQEGRPQDGDPAEAAQVPAK